MTPYVRKNYTPDRKSWHAESTISIEDFSGGMNNSVNPAVISDNEASDTMNMKFVGNGLMQKRFGTKSCFDKYLDRNSIYANAYNIQYAWKTRDSTLFQFITNHDDSYYMFSNCYEREFKYFDRRNFDVFDFHATQYFYLYNGNLLSVNDNAKVISTPTANTTAALTETLLLSESFRVQTSVTIKSKTQIYPSYLTIMGSLPYIFRVISEPTCTTVTDGYEYTFSSDSLRLLGFASSTQEYPTVDYEIKFSNDAVVYPYYVYDESYVSGNKIIWSTDYDEYSNTSLVVFYAPCINELKDSFSGLSYIPDNISVYEIHNDRLFLSGDSEQPNGVFMSAPNNPFYFPANASLQLSSSKNPIIDLISFDGSLIIGRKYDLYLLSGSSIYEDDSSSDYFTLKKIDSSVGFMCKNCGDILNNFYIFIGNDRKFYKLSSPKTTDADYLMTKPLSTKIDIGLSPFNITESLDYMQTFVFGGELYFHLSKGITIIYNYDSMAFTYYSGLNNNIFFLNEDDLYLDCENGLVCIDRDSLNTGVCFDIIKLIVPENKDAEPINVVDPTTHGTFPSLSEITVSTKAIESHWYSKSYNFGSIVNYKYVKKFLISSKLFDSIQGRQPSCFSLSLIVDGKEIDDFYSQYTIPDDGDDNEYYNSPLINLDVKCRNIRFMFENSTINSPMLIFNLTIVVTSRDMR